MKRQSIPERLAQWRKAAGAMEPLTAEQLAKFMAYPKNRQSTRETVEVLDKESAKFRGLAEEMERLSAKFKQALAAAGELPA